MSLKNYIFSSINTKGGQDTEKFGTIRIKSSRRKMVTKNGDGTTVGQSEPPTIDVTTTNANVSGNHLVDN